RLKGDSVDNPDQRIADDIRLFVNGTLDIGIALLGSVVTLVSFIVILWNLSATTPLMIGNASYEIPGYLVWAALIYSVIGTWVTHLVGRPLIKLNYDQQRYEADFRFSLGRLRENAEEVTLLAGEPAEEGRPAEARRGEAERLLDPVDRERGVDVVHLEAGGAQRPDRLERPVGVVEGHGVEAAARPLARRLALVPHGDGERGGREVGLSAAHGRPPSARRG
ncbi:hypothetical protein FBQ97_07865, partial [Acidobacteria bacterium ACD]|nr:hypothetical protein [Acidobacteria bacterium ACD]